MSGPVGACYRLLAAVAGPPERPAPENAALAREGFEAGLDVRVSADGATRFVEVAWGDCACSLYTRAEGRRRLGALLARWLAQGRRVQLLCQMDGEPVAAAGEPATMALARVTSEGLSALPPGRVVELIPTT